ncbi:MAG TPA: SH3 domain-containing protein [Bauldia sp.]|nr:SH3 domain-containing protein [Bauldia sp.]
MQARTRRLSRDIWSFCLAFAALAVAPANAPEAASLPAAGVQKSVSGLPVPRFVSLKAARVNVRVGPGEDYKVAWVFTRPGLPIEVIAEFDNWRRIRDSDGTVGWVFQSLLSGKRTVVVAPWQKGDPLPIRSYGEPDSTITAYLEPGVMGTLDRCRNAWCRISGNGFSGWIPQDRLWGVYPNEDLN